MAVVSHFEHPRIVPRIFIFRKTITAFPLNRKKKKKKRERFKTLFENEKRNDKVKFVI